MTNEDNLSQAIDRAATAQAKDICRGIERALSAALQPLFRPKEANSEWIGADVKTIVTWYASTLGYGVEKQPLPSPSKELVAHCRAQILKTLINGIPAFERILELSKEEAGATQCELEA